MQLNQKMLEQLQGRIRRDSYPHVNYSTEVMHTTDLWKKAGYPHIWKYVESANGFHAFRDIGHGKLCVFKGELLIGVSESEVITDEVVFLDNDQYETGNQFYFPAK